MSHSIRLRDPWQVSEVSQNLPAIDAPRTLLFKRKFNLPTGLVSDQRIELALKLEPGASLAAGSLNEHALNFTNADDGLLAELQDHLLPFNYLELTIVCAGSAFQRFSDCASAELRI